MPDDVERLATFLMENIPGELSRSEGAVDTAIRLLKQYVPLYLAVKFFLESGAEPPYFPNEGDAQAWFERRDGLVFNIWPEE